MEQFCKLPHPAVYLKWIVSKPAAVTLLAKKGHSCLSQGGGVQMKSVLVNGVVLTISISGYSSHMQMLMSGLGFFCWVL